MIFLHPVILRDAETANRISSSKYEELRNLRTLTTKSNAADGRGGDGGDKQLPEIKIFRDNSDIRSQQATGGSAKDNLADFDRDIESKELEWVEQPDGSLILQ